jgi:hypothetical protein
MSFLHLLKELCTTPSKVDSWVSIDPCDSPLKSILDFALSGTNTTVNDLIVVLTNELGCNADENTTLGFLHLIHVLFSEYPRNITVDDETLLKLSCVLLPLATGTVRRFQNTSRSVLLLQCTRTPLIAFILKSLCKKKLAALSGIYDRDRHTVNFSSFEKFSVALPEVALASVDIKTSSIDLDTVIASTVRFAALSSWAQLEHVLSVFFSTFESSVGGVCSLTADVLASAACTDDDWAELWSGRERERERERERGL